MSSQPVKQLLKRLWHHVSPRRQVQFGMLLTLMIFASFAEVVSIGAVVPFLGVLTAPEWIFAHSVAQPVIQVFGWTEPGQLLLPITLVFSAAALMAGAMRFFLMWASTRLSYGTGADLSIKIYRQTLYQSYAVHCERNSSEIINGIVNKTGATMNVIHQCLIFISSLVMLSFILFALLVVEPFVAITAFAGFGSFYGVISYLTRRQQRLDSECIARESSNVIKSLQEGLGGIRDMLIDGSQEVFCQVYRNADLPLRHAQGNSVLIANSPRYAMEAIGMVLIAALAYVLSQRVGGVVKAIPVLGALALGAQRLLPVLQQAYGAIAVIRAGQTSLQDSLELLDQPLPEHADLQIAERMPFNQNIRIESLGFRYNAGLPDVLRQLSINIPKGSRVGFIGTTGSGKSTLLDIVMGLLQPTEGTMKIDGQVVTVENKRAWQAHIAHVPQSIFLADSTIEENIAFGVPKGQIDRQRVRHAAQQAQIADSIDTWPEKYKTIVGERGVRLSGGQRQRIGIARALYKQADVIIFDEATSALDSETEQAVMQAIESLSQDLTLLIIAHRLTTVRTCSQIVELEEGTVKRIGTYQSITNQSESALKQNKDSPDHAI